MRTISRLLFLVALCVTLSGCTPAVYIRLYNATGDAITLTRSKSKGIVSIPPSTAADLSTIFLSGERLVIRTPRYSWGYSLRDFNVPLSLYQQHFGVMRGYARIDARGHIYMLAPPPDGERPRDIAQPAGFPLQPRTKT